MTTIKIIDTCTLINIFERIEINLNPCMKEYNLVTTDLVIAEYTRKIPREIPGHLSVIGMREEDKAIMEEMEYLFPRLGIGERSVFVSALNAVSSGDKVVILSDDIKAIKNFSKIASSDSMRKRFPKSKDIIWGNTLSMVDKFKNCGKLSIEQTDIIYKNLN